MVSEPSTLYKLMILYMLKKVNFPLTNGQLNDFFSGKDYAGYFTLQTVISELVESNLIHAENSHNSTRYEITKEGDDCLYFFGKQISSEIVSDMDQFIAENKFKMRSEVGVIADYEKADGNGYTVKLSIREGRDNLIDLRLNVPTEQQAESMCDKWSGLNQDIYAYVMQKLL